MFRNIYKNLPALEICIEFLGNFLSCTSILHLYNTSISVCKESKAHSCILSQYVIRSHGNTHVVAAVYSFAMYNFNVVTLCKNIFK